jgi:KaiC/GvpD/RAD55 family RecA-like ATPase
LSESVDIPLLAELIPGGVKPGAMLLVESDPDSQWLAVATTVVARLFQQNRHVCYLAMARSIEDVKRCILELGVDILTAEKSGRLVVEDWYSATLTGGRLDSVSDRAGIFEPIQGGLRVRSLKIADLSVEWLKTSKTGPQAYDIVEHWPAGSMIVVESFSSILRFNEEKAFVEWIESRVNPEERKRKSITLQGVVRGIHSDWLYGRMESASDGIIDLRVMERGEEQKNLLRVRSLKGQPHDSRWHEIEIKSSGEATIVDTKAGAHVKS